jgi:hypothetical protein
MWKSFIDATKKAAAGKWSLNDATMLFGRHARAAFKDVETECLLTSRGVC